MAKIFYIEKCYKIDDDENVDELINSVSDGLIAVDYDIYQAPIDRNQKCIKIYYLRE